MATGLIATNGMKTIEQWDDLTREERQRWLASLTDVGVRAQASVITAHDARWPVERVVRAWAATGLISRARAEAVLAQAVRP